MLNKGEAAIADLVSPQTLSLARERHVYQQQALKEALLASRPRELAFSAYCDAIELHGACLQEKRLSPLLDAVRESGLSLQLLDAGGEAFVVRPPPVFGEGNQRPLQGRQRARYLACFGNARVRSRSSAVELDSVIAFDFETRELESIDDRLNLDPAVFCVDADRAQVIVCDEPVLRFDEAFSLLGSHSWAFGHWMWEFLPRYLAACLAGLPAMPVIVDAGMPAQHRQSLLALLPDGASLVELPARSQALVARLWVAPTPMYMPQYERMNDRFNWDPLATHPGRFAGLVREWNQRVRAEPGAAKRLYFARRGHRHRKLLNHEAIEALAIARGFERVFPEDLDFNAQVALVRGAEQIIGPEGSAMFLAFFARPGTRIGILNHPYTLGLPVLTGLLEAIGLDVAVLTGPAATRNAQLPHFVDYRIDAGAFEAFLDRGAGQ